MSRPMACCALLLGAHVRQGDLLHAVGGQHKRERQARPVRAVQGRGEDTRDLQRSVRRGAMRGHGKIPAPLRVADEPEHQNADFPHHSGCLAGRGSRNLGRPGEPAWRRPL